MLMVGIGVSVIMLLCTTVQTQKGEPMRLIDADALKDYIKIFDIGCGCSEDYQKSFLNAIDKQPTIEPEQFNPCTVCQEFDCSGCKFRRR